MDCLFFLHNWAAVISPTVFNHTPPHFMNLLMHFALFTLEKRPVRRPESLHAGREKRIFRHCMVNECLMNKSYRLPPAKEGVVGIT